MQDEAHVRTTDAQSRVLEFIRAYVERHGLPPTVREIASGLGFKSTNAAYSHIKRLRRKGLVDYVPGTARGIRLTTGPDSARATHGLRTIPIVGRIAAGRPIYAQEEILGYVSVDSTIVPGAGQAFALRVDGDSMTGDGIFPGDIVFVRSQPLAEPGDIVVALLDEEATVKRFVRGDSGTVVLRSSNPAYEDIVVDRDRLDRFRILGVVVGVYHRF